MTPPPDPTPALFIEKWRWFLKDELSWHIAFKAEVIALLTTARAQERTRCQKIAETHPTIAGGDGRYYHCVKGCNLFIAAALGREAG